MENDSKKIDKFPETDEEFMAALMAGFEEVGKVVEERARLTGTPIIVGENGRVVRLDPVTLKEIKP